MAAHQALEGILYSPLVSVSCTLKEGADEIYSANYLAILMLFCIFAQ